MALQAMALAAVAAAPVGVEEAAVGAEGAEGAVVVGVEEAVVVEVVAADDKYCSLDKTA